MDVEVRVLFWAPDAFIPSPSDPSQTLAILDVCGMQFLSFPQETPLEPGEQCGGNCGGGAGSVVEMSKASERGTAKINQEWVDHSPVGTHTIGDGLILVVRERDGKRYKEYRLRIQIAGHKRQDIALGSARVIYEGKRVVRRLTSLEEAKRKARIARTALENGDDVKIALGKKEPPTAKNFKIDAVLLRYFESIKSGLKNGGEAGNWWSPVKNHVLPALGNESAEAIDADRLYTVFKPLFSRSPSTGRKAFTRLRGSVEYARAEGAKVDMTCFADAKKRIGTKTKKAAESGKRIPSTPWEEVPELYAKICELEATPARLALRLIILTAHRFSPVSKAKFSHFNLTDKIWVTPHSHLKAPFKDVNGDPEDFRTPLSEEALSVVGLASKLRRGDDLFPAFRGTGFVTDVGISKTLNLLDENGRTHGFRASFKTWANNQKVAYEVSEYCLQHKFGDAVSRAYERDDRLDQRREVMEDWGKFVTSQREKANRARLRVVK